MIEDVKVKVIRIRGFLKFPRPPQAGSNDVMMSPEAYETGLIVPGFSHLYCCGLKLGVDYCATAGETWACYEDF